MKRLLTICSLLILSTQLGAYAQQVVKAVVAEHFTNSYCSICASRNPGLYSTLSQQPSVLHIAYHPSSPYPMCPINQHNKAENDDRTNYYGVFGSTPRLVVQGNVIPATHNYGDAALYTSEAGKMSSFSVTTTITQATNNTADVTVIIKKVDTSSIANLVLYAAVAEDTLFFSASNGEDMHFDVFRKSVWGAPQNVTSLTNVGDSVVLTQNIGVHNDWVKGRTYVLALLQDGNKQMVQAGKSGTLDFPVNVTMNMTGSGISVYPNPVYDRIMLKGLGIEHVQVSIVATDGRVVYKQAMSLANNTIETANLQSGIYFLSVDHDKELSYYKFLKQ